MYYNQLTYLLRVTNSCFLNCSYCMVRDQLSHDRINETPSDLAPHSLVEAMFNKAIGFGEIYLTFVGGEPMMAGKEWFRRTFEIMRSNAEKRCISVSSRIYTNGLLLDDEWIELFKANGCQIFISWDGLGFGQKGSKKAYEIITRYAKHITTVTPVISKANCHAMTEIYKQLNQAGVKRMTCQYDIYASTEQMIEFGNATCELFKYIESEPQDCKTRFLIYHDAKAMAQRSGRLSSNEMSAAVLNNDYVINPDGEVILGLPQDDDERFRLGNLLEISHVNDLLFSPKMRWLNDCYVKAQSLIGKFETTNKLTRGGGFFFDKKQIQDMDKPFMAKLACYHVLLSYFTDRGEK